MSVYGFYKTARLVHFLNKDNERDWKNKYTRLRGVAEKLALSSPARQKLEWIIFYQTVGRRNASYVAKYFGITRKTLHKWLKRFDEGQNKLKLLAKLLAGLMTKKKTDKEYRN